VIILILLKILYGFTLEHFKGGEVTPYFGATLGSALSL
jgi:hypothetical protein